MQRWRWASLSLLLCSLRGTELAPHTQRRRGFHSDTDTVVWDGMYVQGILFGEILGRNGVKLVGCLCVEGGAQMGKPPWTEPRYFPSPDLLGTVA